MKPTSKNESKQLIPAHYRFKKLENKKLYELYRLRSIWNKENEKKNVEQPAIVPLVSFLNVTQQPITVLCVLSANDNYGEFKLTLKADILPKDKKRFTEMDLRSEHKGFALQLKTISVIFNNTEKELIKSFDSSYEFAADKKYSISSESIEGTLDDFNELAKEEIRRHQI